MEKKTLTLGSLFDGSGGFPLGGILAGIEPRWSSEIEPFPVLVTHKRLPQVRHYGDVSTLSGADLEPVDIITFGSPCQDMSIAGKRAGLDGARSGLFHQTIRIIKEMREKTNGEKPRFICWENVPGAFSSNNGEDFRAVLEAVIGVKEEGVSVPAPADHRWPKADVYLGDGWSVAYRTLDAQYWGVAQRRARIYLVADFAGGSAGEILFKSEGVSGYTPQGFRAWEGTARGTEECAGEAGWRPDAGSGERVLCVNPQGNSGVGITENKSLALVAQDHGNHPAIVQAIGIDGYNAAVTDEKAATLGVNCGMSTGRNGVIQAAGFCTEHSAKARSIGYEEEKAPTLRAGVVPAALSIDNHPTDSRVKIAEDGKVQTLTERMGTGGMNVPLVAEPECRAFGVCSKQSHAMLSDNPRSGFYEAKTSRTLDRGGGNPTCAQGGICVIAPAKDEPTYCATTGSFMTISKDKSQPLMARDYKDPQIINDTPNEEPVYIVRRLTPVECARLQGFPDWWCDDLAIPDPTTEELTFWMDVWETWRKLTDPDKKPKTEKAIRKWLADPYTDAAEYKLWGNGVALPCVYFVLSGIEWAAQKDI